MYRDAIRSVSDIKDRKIRGIGLPDCSQGYSYAVTALKQQDVMKTYTLLDGGQVGGVGLMMNKDSLASLSADQLRIPLNLALVARVGR
jgi:hypothetical protein